MTVTVSRHAQYMNLETPSPVKMSGNKRRRHADQENRSFFLNGSQLVPEFPEQRDTAYPWLARVKMEHELARKITSLFPPEAFHLSPLIQLIRLTFCKVAESRSQFRVTLKSRSWAERRFIRTRTMGKSTLNLARTFFAGRSQKSDWISELRRVSVKLKKKNPTWFWRCLSGMCDFHLKAYICWPDERTGLSNTVDL